MTTVFANKFDQSRILEPVLNNYHIKNWVLPDFRSLSPRNSFKLICNYIYNILPFNKLQQLIVEGIFYYVLEDKSKMRIAVEDWLLLYLRSEGDIAKSWVI